MLFGDCEGTLLTKLFEGLKKFHRRFHAELIPGVSALIKPLKVRWQIKAILYGNTTS